MKIADSVFKNDERISFLLRSLYAKYGNPLSKISDLRRKTILQMHRMLRV